MQIERIALDSLRSLLVTAVLVLPGIIGCHGSKAHNVSSDVGRSTSLTAGDAQSDRRSVTLLPGQVFTLRLRGQAGTGYFWRSAENMPAGGVVRIVPGDEQKVDQSTVETLFTIRAIQPGRSALLFLYSRSADKDSIPARQFTLDVDVEQ
jgi:predicted secreted protein